MTKRFLMATTTMAPATTRTAATQPPMLAPAVAEREARAFALECLQQVRLLMSGLGDPFSESTMHAYVREMMKALAIAHPRNMLRIIDLAMAGAEDADIALRNLIAERQESGQPLGPALTTYSGIIAERTIKHRHPRSWPPSNFLQNAIIIGLLIELQRRGLNLRRRPGSKRLSACAVVAEALTKLGLGRGGEDAIRKIWDTYGPPVIPGWYFN